jgi:hypothetical protein
MGYIVVVRAAKWERYAPRAQGISLNVDNWFQNALLRNVTLNLNRLKSRTSLERVCSAH